MFRNDSAGSTGVSQEFTGGDQDSQGWHEWRSKGLGSSDAPVLMGVSPWRTITELWQEKALGIKKDQSNWATQRGKDLESTARDMYEFEYDVRMAPKNFIHKRFSYMRGSSDGFSDVMKYGIEIKCPGKADLNKARQGQVPEKYVPQLQWLMLVSGSRHIDYCSFDGKTELVVIKVHADLDYQRDLIRMARWFWMHVRHKIELKPINVWDLI